MGSPFVFFFYTCIIMNSSINFNYKLLLVTVKIGYEFSSRVLSSEFQSIKSFISKFFPKYFFCIGHLSSETVRPFENLSRCSVCQIIYMFFHSEDGVPLSLRRGVRGEAKILFVKFPSAAAHELFCFPLPGLRFQDGQYTLAAHLSDKEKRCGANIPRLPNNCFFGKGYICSMRIKATSSRLTPALSKGEGGIPEEVLRRSLSASR